MRLKMGRRSALDVSIGLEMCVPLFAGGGGLLPPELLPLLPARLSESRSEASDPTGDGESSSGMNLVLPLSELLLSKFENPPMPRLWALEPLLNDLLLEEKSGETKSLPNKNDDALEMGAGLNGLLFENRSSVKYVLIGVGDSLSDDGGDGESAVDPLPP